MANRPAAQRGSQTGRGQCFQSPLQAKYLLAHFAKILTCHMDDLGILLQRRQDIDEAEELRLERGIFHRKVDGRLRPPTGVEQSRRVTGGQPGQLRANGTNTRFKRERIDHEKAPELSRPCCFSVYTPSFLLKIQSHFR